MGPGGQPEAQGITPAWQVVLGQPLSPRALWTAGLALIGVLALAIVVTTSLVVPSAAQAEQQFQVWRSTQFGLRLSHPTSWTVVEERADPERGDVLILGNETSALLVGLLHDTRTPRQMAEDLLQTQKEQTPDLAVVQSSETSAGSMLMFLQYTIHPGSDSAMLIDEKVLLGSLQAGSSTITLRGMVPDRANVESQFDEIESIIQTLSPDRVGKPHPTTGAMNRARTISPPVGARIIEPDWVSAFPSPSWLSGGLPSKESGAGANSQYLWRI